MKFQFDVDEQQRSVQLDRQPEGFRVLVDGRSFFVDAVQVGGEGWSLLVRDQAGTHAASVDAVVLPQNGDGSLQVYIGGQRVAVTPRGARRGTARGAASGSGPQRVLAPMPGKVVRVLVSAGDEVQARQGLVVVEAMKMENELRAGHAGRVRDVFVREGQSVDAGTALVLVE